LVPASGPSSGEAALAATQLAFLRDQLAEERQKREAIATEMMRSQTAMLEKMRALE